MPTSPPPPLPAFGPPDDGPDRPPLPPDGLLEALFLGGHRKYTRAEVAELAGVPQEQTLRLWRALGFPAVDDEAAVFTDSDVEAARLGHDLVESGLIDRTADTAVTRALGHHLSRLAEWQVHVVWNWLARQPGPEIDERQATRVAEAVLPAIERLQTYVWRRHLAAYAGRALAAGEEPESRSQVIGFADMVGYTTLTRRIDETELSMVLERFEELAGDAISEHHGRVVKMIGDEVLFVADSPAAGAELALTLAERAAADPRLPELRIGLAHGRVLHRLGDVYGPVVNVAARLTALARPTAILADGALAAEIGSLDGYRLRALRPVAVRGYPRLRPYVLRRAGTA
jgi:adenylate cyclase